MNAGMAFFGLSVCGYPWQHTVPFKSSGQTRFGKPVLEQGLPQTVDYARRCGTDEAHLLIFDCRPQSNWDERVWRREDLHDGMQVMVWGA